MSPETIGWAADERPPLPDDAELNGAGIRSTQPSEARLALEASRVDLVTRIGEGLPDRQFVPGGERWLLAGKRYVFVAPAGTGKSLVAIIVALDVIEAGGSVAILDVDMGADESVYRLADVLAARDPDGSLAAACQDRLHYFDAPRLSKHWSPEEWVAAFGDVDGVILDSSRLILSAHGLREGESDDYAQFAATRLVPLSAAGKFTVMLDNTGHGEQQRSRGTKAKDDLNEVVFSVSTKTRFDRESTGAIQLKRTRTRFPEIPAALTVAVGGGVYGPVEPGDAAASEDEPATEFRPTTLMERLSEAIEVEPGMGVRDLRASVKGQNEAKTVALRLLVSEGYVEVRPDGQAQRHFSSRLYRALDDPKAEGHE